MFGRGLDTEWSPISTSRARSPILQCDGTATLVRGSLDLAGSKLRFRLRLGAVDGPIRSGARRHLGDAQRYRRRRQRACLGSPVKPEFTLESTPSLPQDEILARVIFGKSASQLSALEAAQLAASLAQLAGGQAGFDPAGLISQGDRPRPRRLRRDRRRGHRFGRQVYRRRCLCAAGRGRRRRRGAEVEWEPNPASRHLWRTGQRRHAHRRALEEGLQPPERCAGRATPAPAFSAGTNAPRRRSARPISSRAQTSSLRTAGDPCRCSRRASIPLFTRQFASASRAVRQIGPCRWPPSGSTTEYITTITTTP